MNPCIVSIVFLYKTGSSRLFGMDIFRCRNNCSKSLKFICKRLAAACIDCFEISSLISAKSILSAQKLTFPKCKIAASMIYIDGLISDTLDPNPSSAESNSLKLFSKFTDLALGGKIF